jgi:Zn-finger nucleic acid-binding protein
MRCPLDNTELVMTDRQGIEIDYCPKCRGVWLDRGELDKIIERNTTFEAPKRASEHLRTGPSERPERDDFGRYGKPRKRKSFLGEIFDFD